MKKLIAIVCMILLVSCTSNEKEFCETWEVQEWIKEGNTTVQDTQTKTKFLCGDDIKPAGTTYVWYQNGYIKNFRKMIKKVN